MSDAKTENKNMNFTAGDTSNFEAGTRCRLSELGKSRSPKLATKIGKILRKARTKNQVHLLLDGHTTPITLHRTYIEVLPPDEDPAKNATGVV